MTLTLTEGQLAILVTVMVALITAIIALIRIFWVAHASLSERVLTLEVQQRSFYEAFGELKRVLEKNEVATQEKIDKVEEKIDSLQLQLFHAGYPLPVRATAVMQTTKEKNQ